MGEGERPSHPVDLSWNLPRKAPLKAPDANAKLRVPIHRLEREPEPDRIVAEGS